MFAIKKITFSTCYEKLATICILATIRHWKQARLIVLQLEIFIRELNTTKNRHKTRPIVLKTRQSHKASPNIWNTYIYKITALNHEIFDNSMERTSFITNWYTIFFIFSSTKLPFKAQPKNNWKNKWKQSSYLKFSAVFGTTSEKSSIFIRPTSVLPMAMSKNTTGLEGCLSCCWICSQVVMIDNWIWTKHVNISGIDIRGTDHRLVSCPSALARDTTVSLRLHPSSLRACTQSQIHKFDGWNYSECFSNHFKR